MAKQAIYRKDYQPTDFIFGAVKLHFDLFESATKVSSDIEVMRNPKGNAKEKSLQLYGDDLALVEVKVNDEALPESAYTLNDIGLLIHDAPDAFNLKITTVINPADNTKLEGLYFADNLFCTQCEPHGFRRITFFLDRPDVLATSFTTTLVADKAMFPVLLANGNQIDQGEAEDDRHFATWHDPHPKPCYLFALVAGTLELLEDSFTTMSGKEVTLRIYVEPGFLGQTAHAMTSLKQSMTWDEQAYGREYDLDIFMIVAVRSFNMGAMENKGLNVFNNVYILADAETATDADYEGIATVVGHEYFHNWSGNRVTCQDWFQLSLKEGFTVFRDQSFTAHISDPTVKRIQDVNVLRSRQFPEDGGPMSHPIRPDAYIEMNNFYTATVYNKGAEVIRMQYHLLGEETFRKGTDQYFSQYDGQAVTCDHFVNCMADVSGIDMTQFKLWYSQSGTPSVTAKHDYDAKKQQFSLTLKQTIPSTAGQTKKQAMHIPISMTLLDAAGNSIPAATKVLSLKDTEQTFTFDGIKEKPVPSLLRGFSAPIKLDANYSDEDLMHLMLHETDGFNRWDAGQQLSSRIIFKLMKEADQSKWTVPESYIHTLKHILCDDNLDKRLKATLLHLPSEIYLAEQMTVIDPDAIHAASNFMCEQLAEAFVSDFNGMYADNQSDSAYVYSNADVARRALKNTCLMYLGCLKNDEAHQLAMSQFESADNMTDSIAALRVLSHMPLALKSAAFDAFYQRWHHHPIVLNKWFALQAGADVPAVLDDIHQLMKHEKFSMKNPNTMRSVVGTFSLQNMAHFHAADGSGYAFLGEQLRQLNHINPLVAARLITPLTQFKRYDDKRQALMRAQLEDLQHIHKLSPDLYEVIEKSLAES
ncbi:MAG: aminopeptidase N [marine bacterium B5-7]|nr:MAG: aminopeptidase N [marine bacterium B5-7]